ncbi:MAG: hypothetical protein QM758_05180 [Armatimonas sp.]
MKLLLFALRLMALGIVFFALGCGGGGSGSSDPKFYTLSFQFTSGAESLQFKGDDLLGLKSTGQVEVGASSSETTTTIAFYITNPSTNIKVTVYNNVGTELTQVTVNGVHVEDAKTSYIYASYNGTKLTVDATRPAGVP